MSAHPADRPPAGSVAVVGAGLAGARTVHALRAAGYDGAITLLGAEGVPPYDRPLLSKELLSRPGPVWLVDDLALDLSGADVRLAEPALALRLTRDGVVLQTSVGEVAADAVVVATGAAPVRPWPQAMTLHTARDAAALREVVGPGRRLVVVGAGWIGAEVAGVAAAAGTDVTVVEAGAAPLAAALHPDLGARTIAWYEAAGVRLLLGSRALEVSGDRVVLNDAVLHADAVLVAVGVRPATAWLAGSVPLAPDGSVEVDAAMRAPGTDGRVLAVGDAAARASRRWGRVPGGHWDGALRTPEIAAATLLGLDPGGPPSDPAPYLWSDQLGHHLTMTGRPDPGDDLVLRADGDGDGAFGAVWFRGASSQVSAILTVDRPRDVAAARRLFAGHDLPRVDRAVAADPTSPLRPLPS